MRTPFLPRDGAWLGNLLAVAFVALFVAGLAVAAVDIEAQRNARVACARNLRMIGQAILFYANDNHGGYPRTIMDTTGTPTPTWGTGPATAGSPDPFTGDNRPADNDVSAALFLLLRTQDLNGSAFACPSTNVDGWDFGGGGNTAQNWVNWPQAILPTHLSYSYQNPYPQTTAVANGWKLNTSLPPTFAVAADINPGSPALLKLSDQSTPDQIRAGNSPNHNGDGQNVLYGDGHVEFATTPLCGTENDNIYTFGKNDGIVGSPTTYSDSILLPTAQGQKYDADREARFVPPNRPHAAATSPGGP